MREMDVKGSKEIRARRVQIGLDSTLQNVGKVQGNDDER